MKRLKPLPFTLDFYGLQPRLIWANERTLTQEFLDMATTAAADETVAWFIEKGSVTVAYRRGVEAKARAGEWLFLRAEDGRQHFAKGTRLMSLRFRLRLRGGKQGARTREEIRRKSKNLRALRIQSPTARKRISARNQP